MASRIPPRLVDGGILVSLLLVLGTGLLTLVASVEQRAWVFTLHGVVGVVLVPLLAVKLRRVLPSVRRAGLSSATPWSSILLTLLAVAAIASGVGWITLGTFRVGPWPGLAFHAILGVLLVPVVIVHLWPRFRVPTTADLEGRRTALQAGVLVGTGVLAWRVQQAVGTLLDGERRFTGSRTAGTGTGNDFPVTSWVADDPDPIDPADWRLTVDGRGADPTTIRHEDLTPDEGTVATLDCTSGWYATRTWRGVRIGELLKTAGAASTSRWVTVESVTGYRVNLPIEEARAAVLATHVGDDPLDHGHGAPARLVVPGRRGFQWVKWVTRITVRDRPDYGAWVSIFTSGFTRNRS